MVASLLVVAGAVAVVVVSYVLHPPTSHRQPLDIRSLMDTVLMRLGHRFTEAMCRKLVTPGLLDIDKPCEVTSSIILVAAYTL